MGTISHVTEKRLMDIILYCRESGDTGFVEKYVAVLDMSARTLCQFKCIEILKWNLSYQLKKDVGREQAEHKWYELGYAKAFSQIYDHELTIEEIYNRTEALVVKEKAELKKE
jgi:hypothetical protein